jgi:phosphoglycerate kinase
MNLQLVLEPKRPFAAVIAGAKYDTKIGTLSAIYERVDKLILGGVIYNAFLCAKYNIQVTGVNQSDIQAAQALVKQDEAAKKIVELPAVIESDTMEGRIEGKYRTIQTNSFKPGQQYGYFLDVAPESFAAPEAAETIASAKTIFINAVMGFTPHFVEGTSALNQTVDKNKEAKKMFGGGDTLEELKGLNPGLYFAAIDNPSYYFFTGGGTVLTAIEEGSPYSLKPVAALMSKKKNPPA